MIRKLSLLFMDCVLIVLAVLGGLWCLCSAFNFTPPANAVLLSAFCTLLFCTLFRLKHGWISALVVGFLLAFLAVGSFEGLKNSFIRLFQLLFDHYVKGYRWLTEYYPQLEPGSRPNVSSAMLALVLFQVYMLSLSLSCWKRTLPGAVTLLLTVLPCFVLVDTPPAVLPFLLPTFAVLVMALTQSVRRRAEPEAPVALGVASLGALLLLGLALWLIPYEGYQPPLRWETVTEKLQKLGMEIDTGKSAVHAGLDGSTRSIDVEQLARLPEYTTPVMTVHADWTGMTYLRGVAFNKFDGAAWEVDTTLRWDEDCLFPSLGTPGSRQIQIHTTQPSSVYFTPYDLAELPESSKVVSDAFLENTESRTDYTLTAVDMTLLHNALSQRGLTSDTGAKNKAYDEWVRDVCLELPAQTRALLLDWWEENGLPGTLGVDYTVEDVATLVSGVCRYSRDPSRCPAGRDFCDWFLNDAEKGYCVHFSCCLTALLRALGQPARYVSGYVCNTVEGKTVTVTAIHAHAWTEYYAYGSWIPADATPAAASEFTGELPGEPGETGETENVPATRPSYQPGQYSESTEPTHGEVVKPGQKPTQETQPGSGGGRDGSTPQAETEAVVTPLPTWFWVLSGVLLLALLLVLRRRIRHRLWRRKITAADPNTRTILLWKRYLRLCKCLRITPDEGWTALANRAAFSQHRITEEEMDPLRSEIRNQERLLRSAGLAKRFYCWYIIAVM